MSLYVRTSSGGTGPAVAIPDLGYTIPTSVSWTKLLISTPSAPDSGTGLFTARELRDSRDLFNAITGGDLEWSQDGVLVELSVDYVADIGFRSDLSDDALGSGGSDYFIDDTVDTVILDSGWNNLRTETVQLGEPGVYISSDGTNLLFKDEVSTQTTLTELKSMRNIWISSSGLVAGNITLSDITNWNAQYTQIGTIHVVTTSNSWDLWICETSAFDLGSIRTRQIVSGGKQNMVITADIEVNSDSNNLYLRWIHNGGGAPTVSFYITGEARRH